MSNHTPGPWTIAEPVTHGLIMAAWDTIANIHFHRNNRLECRANARLVAASPDLLAACKRVIREIDDISVGAEEDLLAAIEKAEGDTSR